MTVSRFRPVALEHASRLINHGPTVLVTSADGTRRNVMAAAWSMPVEFTPPRIAVVIDKHTYTRELVAASGGFGLCLPGTALAELTYAVGSESGRTVDKFARHGIAAQAGPARRREALEQARQQRGRNTNAVVDKGQVHNSLPQGETNDEAATIGRKLEKVAE